MNTFKKRGDGGGGVCVSAYECISNSIHFINANWIRASILKPYACMLLPSFFLCPSSMSLQNNQIILQRFFVNRLFQLSILFNPPRTHQGLWKIIDEQLQNNMRDGSGDFSFTAVLNKLQAQSVTLYIEILRSLYSQKSSMHELKRAIYLLYTQKSPVNTPKSTHAPCIHSLFFWFLS